SRPTCGCMTQGLGKLADVSVCAWTKTARMQLVTRTGIVARSVRRGAPLPGRIDDDREAAATYRATQLEAIPDTVGAGLISCVRDWAEAIGSAADAEFWLVGLVLRVRTRLRDDPFSAAPASEVGAALVDRHLTDPETLARTAEVFAAHLPALAGTDDTAARTRLTLLLGSLAAGFAEALWRRAIEEHHRLHTRL